MLESLWKIVHRVGDVSTSKGPRRRKLLKSVRRPFLEQLECREVFSALAGVNSNELVNTSVTPEQLATSLVGQGVAVSNVKFTGGAASTGSFEFADPTVVGFSTGIILSSGSAADVVGPNTSDWNSIDFMLPGDSDLDKLSGFPTYDAAVLEFDFVPTANQVVFTYAFASDEYPEWVNTPYNDVFAFYVNGTNYAEVREVAGDPSAPFVPVAVNNINNGNDLYPDFSPTRPDLFTANYFNAAGSSVLDLELDGITHVLTFQAPVNPGVSNHMKLAIADASDGIYDSAVFIQSGSLVSNENPVADLSLTPERGDGPLLVTAIIEGEDPNGAPLTYTVDWGDGTTSTGALTDPVDDNEKTALVDHTYTAGGEYIVTLTVSNGTLSGTSIEDVDVLGGTITFPDTMIAGYPASPSNEVSPQFTFISSKSGSTFEYSLDGADFIASSNVVVLGPLADGSHTIEVRATDPAGNTDPTPASYTWTVDTVAPDTVISVVSADPAPLTLSLSATEASATFEYSLDGGDFLASGDHISFDSLPDGSHTVLARATDAAGNVDPTPATYAWVLDTAPPDTAIDLFPAKLINDATPSFAFSSTEAGSTFEYSLDGSVFTASGAMLDLPTLADGPHTLDVRAVDTAGNVDPTPASFAWNIDTLAPETAIDLKPASPSTESLPTFKFSDSEVGSTFEYNLDGAGFVASGSEVTLGPLADGAHTIEVRATDAAGNVDASPAAYAWSISTAPGPASAAIVADPQNPGQFVLSVVGTSQGETLLIASIGKWTQVRVKETGAVLGTFSNSAFQRVVVFGMEGNDTIRLLKVSKPAELHGDVGDYILMSGSRNDVLFGGAGNDRLYGSDGNDVLYGESGDDLLYGGDGNDILEAGSGNDVLIGGDGADRLAGGKDASLLIGGQGADTLLGSLASDILIGGETKYDENATALMSLLAEWKRADLNYDQRIDHLTGSVPGGLNGKYVLKASTVKVDSTLDSLTGSDGEDWFWGLLTELADQKTGERLN